MVVLTIFVALKEQLCYTISSCRYLLPHVYNYYFIEKRKE